jgi:dihydropyrimidinase
MDLVIRGGTVVTAGGVSRADIGVQDGTIVALGLDLADADTTIDASGAYVFPGGIDVHTHVNTAGGGWGRARADDFLHGTQAAAAGGVTTLCDFAGQQEGGSLQAALDLACAEGAAHGYIDYSFHVIVADPSPAAIAEVPKLVAAGFPTYKFFMPRPAFQARGADYLRILGQIAAAGGMAMFHCEDGAIVDYCTAALLEAGKTALAHYPASRPREVEVSATARAMHLAAVTGVPAYIVHLSCEGALDATRAARARGLPVYVETRPIYLYLTEERFAQADREAAKYVGIPPLRDRHDQAVLWDALRAGDIQTVATDHVGYAMVEKYHAGDTFAMVPPGMSNLETLLPMLYSEGVGKGRITIERFVELIATNPAKLFGLYPRKGTIAIGADADLCILDPARRVTIDARRMHSATDYDVYEGFEVQGWPVFTLSRGEVIFREGELTGRPGRGKLIFRERFRGL